MVFFYWNSHAYLFKGKITGKIVGFEALRNKRLEMQLLNEDNEKIGYSIMQRDGSYIVSFALYCGGSKEIPRNIEKNFELRLISNEKDLIYKKRIALNAWTGFVLNENILLGLPQK